MNKTSFAGIIADRDRIAINHTRLVNLDAAGPPHARTVLQGQSLNDWNAVIALTEPLYGSKTGNNFSPLADTFNLFDHPRFPPFAGDGRVTAVNLAVIRAHYNMHADRSPWANLINHRGGRVMLLQWTKALFDDLYRKKLVRKIRCDGQLYPGGFTWLLAEPGDMPGDDRDGLGFQTLVFKVDPASDDHGQVNLTKAASVGTTVAETGSGRGARCEFLQACGMPKLVWHDRMAHAHMLVTTAFIALFRRPLPPSPVPFLEWIVLKADEFSHVTYDKVMLREETLAGRRDGIGPGAAAFEELSCCVESSAFNKARQKDHDAATALRMYGFSVAAWRCNCGAADRGVPCRIFTNPNVFVPLLLAPVGPAEWVPGT